MINFHEKILIILLKKLIKEEYYKIDYKINNFNHLNC